MLGSTATALLGHRAWATPALRGGKPPILVVLELSGGNDGLNTVVPYADDNYYRLRPTLGIRPQKLLALDDYFGFNPGLQGIQKLWQDNNNYNNYPL